MLLPPSFYSADFIQTQPYIKTKIDFNTCSAQQGIPGKVIPGVGLRTLFEFFDEILYTL
jgi:hypothetical protein